MNKILTLLSLICLFSACSAEKQRVNEEVVVLPPNQDPEQAIAPQVKFFQYEDQAAYPDAILELYTPLGNQIFKPGKVPFEFNVKNFPFDLSATKEFKLFNILNGGDPVGFYSPIFQRDLKVGSYRVVAYLVDEEGLALKNFGNYIDRDFQVGNSRPFPYSAEPYLALNFPRSDQVYEVGSEVIIDFLVVGGDMKLDALKVSIELNELRYQIDHMAPVRIENLPVGTYQVKVRLLRSDGKELDGPFSSVSKDIIVR
ncbi:hypothetical protein LV84_00938 [Algoriphagus ratkowskyi]|uniref:Ig-like domain-containing protein n=1 Tax=Algoriphagus ratkowskyi TaxID=57028 RepID=A0A2W7RYR1_9BACT|nr:hypothetical protein [Algoriphagus ratkowskyi]PZX59729.1 hypothetical protein LV84_00938 [Algoriphagus ratkowskyi]TXD78555.1 hypothetical protein ESW18_07125 [Algoriphagus ratkowskyi]